MDSIAFTTWLVGVRRLDASQRGRVFQELALAEANDPDASDDGATVAAATPGGIEAVPSIAQERTAKAAPGQGLLSQIGQGRLASFGCPHCGGDDIRPWGKAGGKPRYRCVNCRKTFNPLTGTPLAGLHYPDRWQDQARALIGGETIAKAAGRCGVNYTTAFRWRHRFLEALNRDKPVSLSGSLRPMRRLSWSPSRAHAALSRERPVNEVAKPASGACRRSKSRSWWRVTAPARPSMPFCRVLTPPASRRPWGRSSPGPRNCAVTAAQPSRRSRGAPR